MKLTTCRSRCHKRQKLGFYDQHPVYIHICVCVCVCVCVPFKFSVHFTCFHDIKHESYATKGHLDTITTWNQSCEDVVPLASIS